MQQAVKEEDLTTLNSAGVMQSYAAFAHREMTRAMALGNLRGAGTWQRYSKFYSDRATKALTAALTEEEVMTRAREEMGRRDRE